MQVLRLLWRRWFFLLRQLLLAKAAFWIPTISLIHPSFLIWQVCTRRLVPLLRRLVRLPAHLLLVKAASCSNSRHPFDRPLLIWQAPRSWLCLKAPSIQTSIHEASFLSIAGAASTTASHSDISSISMFKYGKTNPKRRRGATEATVDLRLAIFDSWEVGGCCAETKQFAPGTRVTCEHGLCAKVTWMFWWGGAVAIDSVHLSRMILSLACCQLHAQSQVSWSRFP